MSPRNQLEESIEHLRQELAEGQPLSAADRALLDRTLAEVASHLEAEEPGLAESVAEGVYEELQELAERVEHTRPNLSIVLGRIVDALSQLGI
ncbi:MAG: DUF4404 family protein [Spirochaetaceae bacterium]|nr:DUF4404 family protein [Myxococcales bacterium]MCB9724202.1 DUF4404 family protein [Spirochaetaceae bacterium]HPG24114.1 DUF4404 family protein [Myxococcota bacterium]